MSKLIRAARAAEKALQLETEWRQQAEECMRGYAEEASKLRAENERLRAENERLEERLVDVVFADLAARAENERLRVYLSPLEERIVDGVDVVADLAAQEENNNER